MARDLAGLTAEELRLLHREDEVAAMKPATAAIAAAEGELPPLPEEKETERAGGTGGARLAGLGAAKTGGGAFSRRAAALLLAGAGAGAAAAAAAVAAARRRTSLSPDEEERLADRRYDVYL